MRIMSLGVYNRFRFYDPASGVYGSQDPLDVGQNVGTPQGYVHNPIAWADALGLKAHKVTGVGSRIHIIHNKGVVGEQAVDNMLKGNGGEGLGPQTSYTDINGQRRVSDGTTAHGSIEMKNFKIQGCSKQIEAAVEEQWQT